MSRFAKTPFALLFVHRELFALPFLFSFLVELAMGLEPATC
jgi:hypothetical protein